MLFYKVTCEIEKAFKMLYGIATRKKCASGIWLGERFEVKLLPPGPLDTRHTKRCKAVVITLRTRLLT